MSGTPDGTTGAGPHGGGPLGAASSTEKPAGGTPARETPTGTPSAGATPAATAPSGRSPQPARTPSTAGSPSLTAPRRSGLAPRRHWGLVALAGGGMVGFALAALRVPALQRADVVVHDVVAEVGRPTIDKLVVYTTDLGSAYAVLSAAGTLAAGGRVRSGLDLAALGSTAWMVAQNAKRRVRRLRPYEEHGVRRLIGRPTGSSFPSGHACVAAAWATMLADRSATTGARRAFYSLAAWVAATRVYVGVHYPTDVLGGAGLGVALAALWRGPLAGVVRRLFIRAQVAATGDPGLDPPPSATTLSG